jgi:hypothetical protein
MSFLEAGHRGMHGMHGFFDNASGDFAAGWGPFTSLVAREGRKEKKDAAKSKLRVDAQTFEQKRLLTRDEAEAAAMENLRTCVVTELQQMEDKAVVATQPILRIREAAAAPALRGESILEELGAQLADMEKAAISIQAGTVVDTGTFDTDALAEAYADASAGLLAMRAVTARARSILKVLTDEQVRLELAAAARTEQLAVMQREQRQLAEQRDADLAIQASRQESLRRRDLMSRILQVDRELSKEKRRLSSLRIELANLKFAQAQRAAAKEEARLKVSGAW